MRIVLPIVFYALYWGVCWLATGSDKKNLAGLRSYPDAVQRQVRARMDAPAEKSMPAILASNLVLFTVVFSALGLVFRRALALSGYLDAFCYFLAFGEGLGLFDLVVIDLLWWRRTKRIRFSFLPEKQAYQDPRKHLGSFWRGIPLFAATAALTAAIVSAASGF